MRQRRFNFLIFLIMWVHSRNQSTLTVSCDIIYNVNVFIVFSNALNNWSMYSSIRWRFVTSLNNDFDNFFLNIFSNISSFKIFQLRLKFRENFFYVRKSITMRIDKWFDEFFIFSFISHWINLFVIVFKINIKFMIVWVFW